MSDRLDDLRRQRALAHEQLAWFDRELARETKPAAPGSPPAVPTVIATVATPAVTPVPAPLPTPATGNAPTPADLPDLEEYRVSQDDVRQDVRKGCFLYFAGAFVVLGLVIVAIYFLTRRH